MYPVELKSKKLIEYVRRILEKNPNDNITIEDLKQISTLKLNKDIQDDLSLSDLIFFENLQSLSLNRVDIGEKEINILNKLNRMQTLQISNAKIDLTEAQKLEIGLENAIFVNCQGLNVKSISPNDNLKSLAIINGLNIDLSGISELKNLEEVDLPNNTELENDDLNNLWTLKNLKRVNLDGNPQLEEISFEDIDISQEDIYRPAERKDWNNYRRSKYAQMSVSYLKTLSPEQRKSLSKQDIALTAADLEMLKTDEGKELIKMLSRNNNISLNLKTTADISLENLEELHQDIKIDRVHVNTGWSETQDKGYSFETYKAIKKEMSNLLKDIDPNLSEQEKYIALRKKITQNITYDYAVLKSSQSDPNYYASRNLENALLNGTCVCAGYSDLMKNALSEMGIEAKYVEGYTDKGELHAWNQIRLKGDDGKYHWYNDDVTFDATSNKGFEFGLVDDKEFSKTHKPVSSRTEDGGVYACNAEAPVAVRAEKHRKPRTQSRGQSR